MSQHRAKHSVHKVFDFKQFTDAFSTKAGKLKRILHPFLLRILFVVFIAILTVWGAKKLWYSLLDLNFFKVSPATFSFQIPPWVTDRFSYDINHVAGLNEQYGMYENNLTQKIAAVYNDLSLINKVDSIKRVFPNKLNIKLVLRKPAALLKSGNNVYLVDDECVLLPKEYYQLSNTDYENPYIQSNKLERIPLFGSKWNDKRVIAGVELIKFLRANNIHNLFKILAVDVSNVCKRKTRDKSDIVLWTENNTQIRWGCSSLYKEPSELSDEEKLQNLLSIAKSEGTTLEKMEYVDVRWEKPVGKQWTKINDIAEKN